MSPRQPIATVAYALMDQSITLIVVITSLTSIITVLELVLSLVFLLMPMGILTLVEHLVPLI